MPLQPEARQSTTARMKAFTLLEMLVVITIIVVLAALAMPSLGVVQSNNLTTASLMVSSQFDLARQSAIGQNRQLELRFYKIPGDAGGPSAYRAMRIVRLADSKPLGKLERLPKGVVFASEDAYSTILSPVNNNPDPDTTTENVGGRDLPFKAVRFLPDGSTSLDPAGAASLNDQWFISLKPEMAAPATGIPANNYATIQVDPISGRTRTYRP